MVLVRRTAFFIIGVIFSLLGIPGAGETIAALSENLAFVRGILENPFVYAAAVLIAVLFLTLACTDLLVERRLAAAGGPTKREFQADLRHWDKIQQFPLREALWLWHGLEPNSGSFEGTRVFPTFRRVEEALKNGAVTGAEAVEGDWLKTVFSRQQLVDLAFSLGETPTFLIPKKKKRARIDPTISPKSFTGISYAEYQILHLFLESNPSAAVNEDDVKTEVRKWLRSGAWEAIARERVDDILYPFVRLPAWVWLRADRDLYRLRIDGRSFEDVRIRQVKEPSAL